MQWEVDPLHVNVEVLFQLFNTPGTEVAPGSDEIREYVKFDHSSIFRFFWPLPLPSSPRGGLRQACCRGRNSLRGRRAQTTARWFSSSGSLPSMGEPTWTHLPP